MMEIAKCFRALGFSEMPGREELQQRYEQRCAAAKSGTESDRLASRLLEENYRECLRRIEAEA